MLLQYNGDYAETFSGVKFEMEAQSKLTIVKTTRKAEAEISHNTALSLVYTTVKYCASIWLNSSHFGKIDQSMWIIYR